MFATLYQTILYQPIFNLLVFFYNVFGDLGWAIIFLTIIIKLILSPFFIQSIKAQRAMQAIQPKLEALKEKFKDSKDKLGPAMMELYKQEKVSPFSSCLPLLLQFPFLIAVFQVFRSGLSNGSFELVYPFIQNPGSLEPLAFGLINMSVRNIPLAILAGLAQFWQSKTMMARGKDVSKQNNMASAMTKQMMYMMPIITIFIGMSFPAGLTFYWFLTTLLSALQQIYIFREKKVEIIPNK